MAPAFALTLLMAFSIYAEENLFRIQHQCKTTVCFQLWSPDGVDLALVSNGHIQSSAFSASATEEPSCFLPIDTSSYEQRVCRRYPCFLENCGSSFASNRFIDSSPGQTVWFQCALLRSVTSLSCSTLHGPLQVTFVDENGDPVEESPDFSVSRSLACDVTLKVTFRSPKNATFRCLAKVPEQTWTSEELRVRLPPPKRGRGFIRPVPPPEEGGGGEEQAVVLGSRAVVAPTVAVLGAAAAAVVVVVVLNRRRNNAQTQTVPGDSPSVTDDDVLDSDDVVYADVVFSAASDRAFVFTDEEPTVYATVRCTEG